MPKKAEQKTTKPGEMLMFDISSIATMGLGGSRYWCLIVDAHPKMKFSFFIKAKSDLADVVFPFLVDLKAKAENGAHFAKCTVIHCNNAGENQALEERCKEGGLGIKF